VHGIKRKNLGNLGIKDSSIFTCEYAFFFLISFIKQRLCFSYFFNFCIKIILFINLSLQIILIIEKNYFNFSEASQ